MQSKTWRLAHASAIGLAHLNQQTECQDRFACRIVETENDGEVLICVIADGAGSASNGQDGAQLACHLFVEQISDFLQNKNASISSLSIEFGQGWIQYFQSEIVKIANDQKKNLRDYASTLVSAVIGRNSAAFFQIGDGAIIISKDETDELIFAVEPLETLYVNMTDFITDAEAIERLRFELVEKSVTDLIMFSDGISPVAIDYQTNQPHTPFLKPMISPLKTGIGFNEKLNDKLENFLCSPKINEKTDDDKTLIIASRISLNSKITSAETHSASN